MVLPFSVAVPCGSLKKQIGFDEDLMNGELGKLSTALIQGAAMCSSILYLSAGCDEVLIKLFYCIVGTGSQGSPLSKSM